MFSWCAEYCMPRLCCYFSNIKSTLTSAAFFFLFSRQLSVAGQVVGSRPIERKQKCVDRQIKAYCHSMQFFFSFVTVVLSTVPFPCNFNWFSSYYLHDLFFNVPFIASLVRIHVIEGSIRNIPQSVSKQKSKG